MYHAEYEIAGASWVQAATRLLYPRRDDEKRIDRWWARFRALLGSLDAVPHATTSLRVHLGACMEAVLFTAAPAQRAQELRRALGSFTQLDVIADGEIRYAKERAEHDQLLTFPRFRCRAGLPHLSNADTWFAFDFRIHPYLNELLLEAFAQHHEVSYHVNIEALHVEPQWQRAAARNALRVSELGGVPATLEELQHQLTANLGRATHISEEFVGVGTRDACDWLRGALERRFRGQYGRHVAIDFSVEDGGFEESLAATRHKIFFEPLSVDELCSAATSADDRLDLLAWQPVSDLLELMPEATSAADDRPVQRLDYSGMPAPYAGTEPYAFISYKREDLERIKPLVVELGRRGHRIWYDRGIPGGAEWDALIEERVQSCEVLVLFLSQSAVGSKYVRREVKFADTLGKTVVGIRLQPELDLSHGMAMLLNQYQLIDAAVPSLGDEIERALRFVRLS